MENISLGTNYLKPTSTSQGADIDAINSINSSGSEREKLKNAAKEFEAILVSKLLSQMDKTVDREDSLFGGDSKYLDNFKSIMFNQIGRDVANSPHSNIGFAKQIYQQVERSLPKEKGNS